jgi:hypothetical protein
VRRPPWALAALPALALARLLPETGGGLYLRLLAATACLLLPGWLIARALGTAGFSAALAWSLFVVFGAGVVMFGVHSSLGLALVLVAAAAAVALPFAVRRAPPHDAALPFVGAALVAAAGVGFGIGLWFVTAHLNNGDDLFHLARVRKLDAFGHLRLASVDEFADGGLHPGYAFPLWHLFLALVGRVAGVDPGAVVLRESAVLAPAAFLVAWEAGAAVFRRAWAGVATLAAQLGLFALAAGAGGSFAVLALPATAARQLLVPAVIALYFGWLHRRALPGLAALAAASLALAVIHPTYAIFVAIPLGGYVVARFLLVRRELAAGLLGLAAVAVPVAGYALWVRPIADQTVSVDPSHSELERAIRHYGGQLDVFADGSYRIAPELAGRSGAVAVVALIVVPLALFGARRRWGALVLGGSLAVLALVLVPTLYEHLSDLVSISQSRRLVGFVPFAFAVAGAAAVLARLGSIAALPIAFAAGVAFQLTWPGDFAYAGGGGGPAIATWVALFGSAAALALGVLLSRRLGERDDAGVVAACAAVLLVLPVALHNFTHWHEAAPRGPELTHGLVDELRTRVEPGQVVFSDPTTSYRIAAAVPVYVANAPTGHVADTKANRPADRVADARRFFATGDVAILRRYGADWLVVNQRRNRLRLPLPEVWSDGQYALYRVPP